MIFIIGNSRSGTTLMARILSRHPDVYILHETHFIEEFSYEKYNFRFLSNSNIKKLINKFFTIQRKGYYRKNEIENYPETLEILNKIENWNETHFSGLIKFLFKHEAAKFGKTIYGDQTPRHIFYTNEIFSMFPEAMFINMIRDPRAVQLSQKFKYRASLKKGLPLFETIRTYFNYHPLLMSYMWRKGIQKALSVNPSIKKSWIDVKFEDLIHHPGKTIKSVCEFLNIDFHSTMLDVTVSMSSTNTDEGQKGFSNKVVKKWMESLSTNDIYFSEKINRDFIQLLGYDLTDRRPAIPLLGLSYFILPIQFLIIFALNYSRMGNPFNFIKKRLK